MSTKFKRINGSQERHLSFSQYLNQFHSFENKQHLQRWIEHNFPLSNWKSVLLDYQVLYYTWYNENFIDVKEVKNCGY